MQLPERRLPHGKAYFMLTSLYPELFLRYKLFKVLLTSNGKCFVGFFFFLKALKSQQKDPHTQHAKPTHTEQDNQNAAFSHSTL